MYVHIHTQICIHFYIYIWIYAHVNLFSHLNITEGGLIIKMVSVYER